MSTSHADLVQPHPERATTDDTILVSVQFKLRRGDFDAGWEGDFRELELSVIARLDEVIGDDGMAYLPFVTAVDAEDVS